MKPKHIILYFLLAQAAFLLLYYFEISLFQVLEIALLPSYATILTIIGCIIYEVIYFSTRKNDKRKF